MSPSPSCASASPSPPNGSATRPWPSPPAHAGHLPATSLSWRRDALASAIAGHASELVLRALAERAGQAGVEPGFGAQLRTAAGHMARAWKPWREVTSRWDVVTTGSPRGVGLTPVAAEIGDLALRAGRLAYTNPHWTPNRGDAAVVRDPADLARAEGDFISVLAAVHHAADAISRVAATDQQAVIAAAAQNRVYVPVRLLSDKYDIPRPYTLARRVHTDTLLAAYGTAAEASTCVAAALDDLAAFVGAPSSLLAATRQVSPVVVRELAAQHDQRPATRLHIVALVPGGTERLLRELHMRDPALLLRAAVMDQAARDLISEATAKATSRSTVTISVCRTAPGTGQLPSPPVRIASQDAPLASHALRRADRRQGSAPAGPVSHSQPKRRTGPGSPRIVDTSIELILLCPDSSSALAADDAAEQVAPASERPSRRGSGRGIARSTTRWPEG
jgi:hypothetical protein